MAKRGRPKRTTQQNPPEQTYLDRISTEIESNQSRLSMILGGLIILVIGILIFNYFNRGRPSLGPAQQTEQKTDNQNASKDISSDNLPGKYTVKEDDTLFTIAEKYYNDGSKYEEIAKSNNLSDVNDITVGQVLEIPREESSANLGTGGGNNTIWGPKIEDNTYTVQEGDWLSTIAARAYGDIYAFNKIAQANNIPNPDLIYPGQVLNLPR